MQQAAPTRHGLLRVSSISLVAMHRF